MSARREFGRTWWGQEWVKSLEDAAMLDPNRLTRGRSYARAGSVGPIELGPGYAIAKVKGSHGRWYRADVAVRTLAPSEWEQVADSIASKAGHAAALLDGELDPGVVADAEAVDVRLLPGAGDLRPDCSCPDWAEPCKHAAALCYELADELDRDPFRLFLLRGIERGDLMAMVRERRGTAAESETPTEGVDAAAAWAARPLGAPLAPVPAEVRTRTVPRRAGRPAPGDATALGVVAIDARAVDALATDAVERAWSILADAASSSLGLSWWADVARRAVVLGRREQAALARSIGASPQRIAAIAEAWQFGGAVGVEVVVDDEFWSSDQDRLSAARDALVDAGWAKRSVALNWNSLGMRGRVWIVLGPDDRWYRLQGRGRHEELHLDGAPSDDVVDLVGAPS
ncbi:MAG TPA: SWIM zinc finger family protein [Microthrixaceae bacterium]|nr:SWIM zinc finger family protein [Microthrixaceae bacterium]